MEFKLNKIDSDIRKKINEEIKEDKVHAGKGINIKRDIKYEKQEAKESLDRKESDKKHITIDGLKYNHENIDVSVERLEELNEENSKGRVLDTTK